MPYVRRNENGQIVQLYQGGRPTLLDKEGRTVRNAEGKIVLEAAYSKDDAEYKAGCLEEIAEDCEEMKNLWLREEKYKLLNEAEHKLKLLKTLGVGNKKDISVLEDTIQTLEAEIAGLS